MAPPPTVLTLKQSFLFTQTRLLSQPLVPSRQWRRSNARHAEDDGNGTQPLPEHAVDDALFKFNHVLQQYARRTHPPQATRHVAEQLDQLYLDAAERDAGGFGSEGNGEGVDYANKDTIASLAPEWESESDIQAHPMEAKRYADLVAQLQSSNTRRSEAQARLDRLRRMRDVLAPFSSAPDQGITDQERRDGDANPVQPNLVTRDGELERELERMRTLLVRVGARVAQVLENEDRNGGGGPEDRMDLDVDLHRDEKQKVDGLLQKF